TRPDVQPVPDPASGVNICPKRCVSRTPQRLIIGSRKTQATIRGIADRRGQEPARTVAFFDRYRRPRKRYHRCITQSEFRVLEFYPVIRPDPRLIRGERPTRHSLVTGGKLPFRNYHLV